MKPVIPPDKLNGFLSEFQGEECRYVSIGKLNGTVQVRVEGKLVDPWLVEFLLDKHGVR